MAMHAVKFPLTFRGLLVLAICHTVTDGVCPHHQTHSLPLPATLLHVVSFSVPDSSGATDHEVVCLSAHKLLNLSLPHSLCMVQYATNRGYVTSVCSPAVY